MLSWSSEKYGIVVVDFQNSQSNYYLFWKQHTLQKAGDQETSQSKLTFINQRIKIIKKLYIYLIPRFIINFLVQNSTSRGKQNRI